MLTTRGLFWLIIVAALVCFCVTNLPWNLDDFDQAKQAFVSYQMTAEGRWLYQTTPDEGIPSLHGRHTSHRISSKPPGVAWISAAIFLATRSWDLAWRLPSFAAAIALALLVFRAARKAFGEWAAIIALATFTLNLLTVRLATLVRTDMPLALASYAVGVLFFDKVSNAQSWTNRQRWILFGALTAAMFVKGPIVYAFVVPALVVYQTARKWWPTFPNVWSGWLPWIGSLALFLFWVIGGIWFIDGFFGDVIRNEFLGRFHEGVHRSQPFWFYLPHLLQKFAPWSLVIIGLLIFSIRKNRSTNEKWTTTPEMFWLVCWALGGLLLMSFIPSKRVDRIFPVIPPFCLLLAAQVNHFLKTQRSQVSATRLANYFVLFAIVYTGGYSAWRVTDGYRNDRDALEKFGREVRRIAREEHLRVEVARGRDEGLLLYLQRPRFFTDFSLESVGPEVFPPYDCLVVPLDEEPWKSSDLQPRLTVRKKAEHPSSYGLLDYHNGPP